MSLGSYSSLKNDENLELIEHFLSMKGQQKVIYPLQIFLLESFSNFLANEKNGKSTTSKDREKSFEIYNFFFAFFAFFLLVFKGHFYLINLTTGSYYRTPL
jgi:hypothetical protein